MKKFKSIATIFAFAAAIFGAAATDIFASNEVRPLDTYYRANCTDATQTCTTSFGDVCQTAYPTGDQLFEKDFANDCVVVRYKP